MLSNLPNKTVLGERWETVNIVGSGACAQVYKVRSTSNAVDYDLVAKVVPFAKSKSDKVQDRICNTLNYEYMMYNGLLSGFPFCPRVPPKFYGDDASLKVRYMVMEQMDRDLEAVSKDSMAPSPSAIAHYGLQILEGLKWIHQRNFIFVDVKPANFMLKKDKLYFVDCKLYSMFFMVDAPGFIANYVFLLTATMFSWTCGTTQSDAGREDRARASVLGYPHFLQHSRLQRGAAWRA